jgi:hypothetical protein
MEAPSDAAVISVSREKQLRYDRDLLSYEIDSVRICNQVFVTPNLVERTSLFASNSQNNQVNVMAKFI